MLNIRNLTKLNAPRANWERLAVIAMGNKYDLSLVFCGDYLARKLNMTYRGKSYKPNVLSFPIDKNSGEIFINLRQARREYKKFNRTESEHVKLLYIHALAHLSGLDHGKKMDTLENKLSTHLS